MRKNNKDFFHERCIFCGGMFKAVQQYKGITDDSGRIRYYNLIECNTCGLALHVRADESKLDLNNKKENYEVPAEEGE